MKSAPQICLSAKSTRLKEEKGKCLNLRLKIFCMGIFALQFYKNIVTFEKTFVLFEISTFKLVKDEFLTHTLNFSIGSVFF